MASPRANAIANHVETAKRLLLELEEQSQTAFQALGQDSGDRFLAAVGARDQILVKLNGVIEALAHERPAPDAPLDVRGESEASATQVNVMLDEMARVAARALESHHELMARTRMERDRLAAALTRAQRADGVADSYTAASRTPRTQMLSISG